MTRALQHLTVLILAISLLWVLLHSTGESTPHRQPTTLEIQVICCFDAPALGHSADCTSRAIAVVMPPATLLREAATHITKGCQATVPLALYTVTHRELSPDAAVAATVAPHQTILAKTPPAPAPSPAPSAARPLVKPLVGLALPPAPPKPKLLPPGPKPPKSSPYAAPIATFPTERDAKALGVPAELHKFLLQYGEMHRTAVEPADLRQQIGHPYRFMVANVGASGYADHIKCLISLFLVSLLTNRVVSPQHSLSLTISQGYCSWDLLSNRGPQRINEP